MPALSLSRLKSLIDSWRGLRIGVVGDFVLDAYWTTDMTRSQLSRETPLFPRPVIHERYSPGGAANVAWNLATLGVCEVQAFTVLGADWRAGLLNGLLDQIGVNRSEIIYRTDRSTPLFGKIILCNGNLEQEDARLDFINPEPLPGPLEAELFQRVERALPSLDALVIADYHPYGVFSNSLRSGLNELSKQHPKVHFIADSRDSIHLFTEMVIKPNEQEAARLFFPDQPAGFVSVETLQAEAVRQQSERGRPIVITLGQKGCLLVERTGCLHLPAAPVPPPIDPVGAGDTFLAALAACLAAEATPVEACEVATLASAITIRCLQVTGAADPKGILQQYESLMMEGIA